MGPAGWGFPPLAPDIKCRVAILAEVILVECTDLKLHVCFTWLLLLACTERQGSPGAALGVSGNSQQLQCEMRVVPFETCAVPFQTWPSSLF